MRWMVIALGVLALAAFALVAAAFVVQRRLIYHPHASGGRPFPDGLERVHLLTSDVLALVAAYRRAARKRPTIVFFHGNADSLAGADAATSLLQQRGFGLLLIEYRGYAGNPGEPTEEGLYRDGRAALDWITEKKVSGADTILMGNSLGSGVATQLAIERQVGALILVSPFSRLSDAAAYHFPYLPVRLLLRDRYANIDKLRDRRMHLLILHGDADAVIPAAQSREIAEASPTARLVIVLGIGHELAYRMEAQAKIAAWLDLIA